MNEAACVVLGAIDLYAVFAAWLGRVSTSMPLLFVLVGALAGPGALGLIALPVSVAGWSMRSKSPSACSPPPCGRYCSA